MFVSTPVITQYEVRGKIITVEQTSLAIKAVPLKEQGVSKCVAQILLNNPELKRK